MYSPSWLKEHHGLELRWAQRVRTVTHNPPVRRERAGAGVKREQPYAGFQQTKLKVTQGVAGPVVFQINDAGLFQSPVEPAVRTWRIVNNATCPSAKRIL